MFGAPCSRRSSPLTRSNSALGSLDRLVDHSKSFGHPPGAPQPFGQRAEKPRVVEGESGLTKLIKRGTENPPFGIDIAALDEQQCLYATAVGVPHESACLVACSSAIATERSSAARSPMDVVLLPLPENREAKGLRIVMGNVDAGRQGPGRPY